MFKVSLFQRSPLSGVLLPLSVAALALTGCSTSSSYSGTIIDSVSGEPRGELRLIAKSEDTTDLTCMAREATADASGNFNIEGLCGGATYHVELSDELLLIENNASIVGGEPVTGVTLKVRRAPAGDGMYLLQDDELTMVRTFTDVKYETKVDDENEKVAYPYSKPTRLTYVVDPGEFLVISGENNLGRLEFRPLIHDPEKRTFDDGSITDHVWVGVKFTSDTEWERVEAELDEAKVESVQSGERVMKYYPHDALPAGRYAIFGDEDARMFIVDFGSSQDAPAEEDAAEDAAE